MAVLLSDECWCVCSDQFFSVKPLLQWRQGKDGNEWYLLTCLFKLHFAVKTLPHWKQGKAGGVAKWRILMVTGKEKKYSHFLHLFTRLLFLFPFPWISISFPFPYFCIPFSNFFHPPLNSIFCIEIPITRGDEGGGRGKHQEPYLEMNILPCI